MTKPNILVVASAMMSLLAVVLSAVALLRSPDTATPGGQTMSTSFGAEVRNYLLDNPGVLFEAAELYDQQQQQAAVDELKVAIQQNREEIFENATSPVTGNPAGDVTIVEFFDYNCPYCRAAAPMLAEAMAADPGIRLVHKEWPILGPGSDFAALAALASARQGRYQDFHQAMMAYSGQINEASTLEIARDIGIDLEQLRRDLEDPDIRAELDRNYALSGTLRVTGTPTFVIGDEIVRGLVDIATLRQYIAEARQLNAAAGG
jgi:protein-disulfide isomerase